MSSLWPSSNARSRARMISRSGPIRIVLFLAAVWIVGTLFYFQSQRRSASTTMPDGFTVETLYPIKPPPKGSRPPRPIKPVGSVNDRAEQVKASFAHAWAGYERVAWGADEVKPVSNTRGSNLNDWGVSIVDSLDTLILMGMRKEFYHAMEHVEKMEMKQTHGQHTPFFETVIRYLGGFLSAYAMVIDDGPISAQIWDPQSSTYEADQVDRIRFAKVLLQKADALATALLPIFKTDSKYPAYGVNVETGDRTSHGGLLAEIASYQFEYKYIAHLTGKREYYDVANAPYEKLEALQKKRISENHPVAGMIPSHYDINTGEATQDYVAVGALADSAYEYFLKGYLLSGRSEERMLDLWLNSAYSALRSLTFISSFNSLTFITDAQNGTPSYKLEHLSCFYPGLLSLGADLLDGKRSNGETELDPSTKNRYDWAAEAFAETCWLVAANNPCGVGHETVHFSRFPNSNWWETVDQWENDGKKTSVLAPGIHREKTETSIITDGNKPYSIGVQDWLLRPETIESLYLMWRYTNNTAWQDRCYAMHQGIETHAKTKSGYGEIRSPQNAYVLDPNSPEFDSQVLGRLNDHMPSYAFAETFKYLYLCLMGMEQSEALLPRRKWIFSTEAHPFPVFEWTAEQKKTWGIR